MHNQTKDFCSGLSTYLQTVPTPSSPQQWTSQTPTARKETPPQKWDLMWHTWGHHTSSKINNHKEESNLKEHLNRNQKTRHVLPAFELPIPKEKDSVESGKHPLFGISFTVFCTRGPYLADIRPTTPTESSKAQIRWKRCSLIWSSRACALLVYKAGINTGVQLSSPKETWVLASDTLSPHPLRRPAPITEVTQHGVKSAWSDEAPAFHVHREDR